MGLFHAYLKNVYNGNNQYLITFINREIADDWWRMMSSSSSPYAGKIARSSPQFYAQTSDLDIVTFFTHPALPDASLFTNKMLFAQVINHNRPALGPHTRSDNPAPPPSSEITDHISGQWYFIRSKVDSFSCWYLRTSGICAVCGDANCDAIHVSNEYRTRFCVRVRNNPEVPEDFVMIGNDEILIAALKGYIVHIDDAGDLKATKEYQGETDLLFGDLKKRFLTRAERQVNGEVWEYVESVERGAGEIWELVE